MLKKRTPPPLTGTPIADVIDAKELTTLDRLGTMLRFDHERLLIDEGSYGRQCVVMIDGESTIRRDDKTIARVGAGEIAGEIALLTGEPCNADVVVGADSWLYAFSRREFSSLLYQCPQLAEHVRGVAADRLATATP